jgi:hypothetical protein
VRDDKRGHPARATLGSGLLSHCLRV